MADRLRENELYGHGRRGRMFRGEREEESGYAYGRGFGEPGETYERAFEGPGYAYGRGYGWADYPGRVPCPYLFNPYPGSLKFNRPLHPQPVPKAVPTVARIGPVAA